MKAAALLLVLAGTMAGQNELSDYHRAWMLVGQRKLDEAIPILKSVIARTPSFYRAYDLLVDTYGEKRDLTAAKEYLDSLQQDPITADYAVYGLAATARAARDLERSRSYNLACIKGLPNWQGAYKSLGALGLTGDDPLSLHLRNLASSEPESAAIHYGLAQYQSAIHRSPEAVKEYRKALSLLSQPGKRNTDLEFLVRLALANAYRWIGDFDHAIDETQEASRLVEQGDDERKSAMLSALLGQYRLRKDYGQARVIQEQSLALAKHLQHYNLIIVSLTGLGAIERDEGHLEAAAEAYKQALTVSEEGRLRPELISSLQELGDLAVARGNLGDALEYFERSRQISEAYNLDGLAAFALRYLGNVYLLQGDYARALDHHARSVETFRRSRENDYSWQAGCGVGLIGGIYERLGEFRGALHNYQLSLESARRFQDVDEIQRNLIALGSLHAKMNHLVEAEARLEEALGLTARGTYEPYRITALTALAVAQTKSRHFASAIARLREARSLAQKLQTKLLEIRTLNALGQTLLESGDITAAEASWRDALALAEPVNAKEIMWPARGGLGEIARRKGLLQEAAVDLRAAVAIIESLREQAGEPNQKANFFWDKITIYEHLIEVLSQLHRVDGSVGYGREALEYAEKSRARSFLETLATARATADDGRPFDASVIQAELSRHGSALIEYALGERESQAWLVTGGKIVMVRLPARTDIERQVQAFRKLVADRPKPEVGLGEYEQSARRLYAMLVRPLDRWLGKEVDLTIVPDGMLHYLPFETLLDGNSTRVFGESRTISYAPSASVLFHLATKDRKAWPRELLAFGDPVFRQSVGHTRSAGEIVRAAYEKQGLYLNRLPNTLREVTEIAAVFPAPSTTVYVGLKANKTILASEAMAGYKRIHFATHALVDEHEPRRSGLALSAQPNTGDDGILRLTEILRLKLDTDLVVLSACQTGLGTLVRGEGMLGLSRAFLHAGAARLVVSLWPVNDVATAKFMNHFYRKMKDGFPPALALRQAKIAMMHSDVDAYRHPYFWAPFVLLGKP
ncbi:MAG: CHAT domain-containing protein [Bryobacteraceae bacterium]